MKSDLARLTNLIVQVGSNQVFGGVRELFQGLTEERTRRFVNWLASASAKEQLTAEEALVKLLSDSDGERVLRHVCRDVLFGTETISLAALALVASAAGSRTHDPFWSRAASAVDGLRNEDALTFIALLRHLGDFTVRKEWMPICHFDVSNLRGKAHWAELETLYSLGPREIYSGIAELVQRRFFMPDKGRGRLGGVDDVAPTAFFLSPDTARYYRLLGRALEISSPEAFNVMVPLDFARIDTCCEYVSESE